VSIRFIEDKKEIYILLLLTLFSMSLYFGCTIGSKASKAAVSEKEEFVLDEEGGVEMKDVEPLEDLTMALPEGEEGMSPDRSLTPPGMEEIPSLSYEEDVLKERVVIDVENTPLHDVIQTLVRGRGFNLILPEKLRGTVSAKFEDITLQDAFDQLLTSFGYTWHLEGNFLKIVKGEPIWIYKPKYIPINRFNEEVTLGGRGQQGRINSDLSQLLKELEMIKGPQGRFLINEWAGTITGIDLDPTKIPLLEEYLRVVDVKRKMIMMEASVVKVELSDSFSTGIDWDMALNELNDITLLKTGRRLSLEGWSDLNTKGFIGDGNIVLSVANDHVGAILKAMADQGKVSIMASSRTLTVDGRSAYLRVEQEVAFTEETVNYPGGGQSAFVTEKVQTKRPSLEFGVMPRVTDDGYINLNVFMNAEEVYAHSAGEGKTVVPLLSRREMNTNARAQNGQTVVIGGLIQETVTEKVKKVPLLGDIPLLGGLFRHTSQSKKTGEIVMFITPHIVDDAKLKQFADEGRLSIKEMQEADIKGHKPLFKDYY